MSRVHFQAVPSTPPGPPPHMIPLATANILQRVHTQKTRVLQGTTGQGVDHLQPPARSLHVGTHHMPWSFFARWSAPCRGGRAHLGQQKLVLAERSGQGSLRAQRPTKSGTWAATVIQNGCRLFRQNWYQPVGPGSILHRAQFSTGAARELRSSVHKTQSAQRYDAGTPLLPRVTRPHGSPSILMRALPLSQHPHPSMRRQVRGQPLLHCWGAALRSEPPPAGAGLTLPAGARLSEGAALSAREQQPHLTAPWGAQPARRRRRPSTRSRSRAPGTS